MTTELWKEHFPNLEMLPCHNDVKQVELEFTPLLVLSTGFLTWDIVNTGRMILCYSGLSCVLEDVCLAHHRPQPTTCQ